LTRQKSKTKDPLLRLAYLDHYDESLKADIRQLIQKELLVGHLLQRYPTTHKLNTDRSLYDYTIRLKNLYLKKSPPLSKVCYDGKIHVINNALGMHTFASRVQGSKLKSKNEIRIATMFKQVPEPFLRMIIVHELAHLKEKAHDKAFYRLCTHMEPAYHQLEFETRLYLTAVEYFGKIYT